MAIAIHPYISGQPHRIKYLEAVYDHINRHAGVLHWNGRRNLSTGTWRRGLPDPATNSRGVRPLLSYSRANRTEIQGRLASTR